MHTVHDKVMQFALVLFLFLGLAACGSNATPTAAVQLDELQVRTIVNDMLDGYNNVDYAAFSKDMTPALKLVIDETSFTDFCANSVDTLGHYQSIPSLKQVKSDATSSTWLITAKFVHSTEFFNLTLSNATGQIEGMDFGPDH